MFRHGINKVLKPFVSDDRKSKTEWTGTWILFAFSMFIAVIYTPVYHRVVSDVLLADMVLPVVLDLLQYLVRFGFYWSAFSFALHLASFYTWRGCIRFGISYTVCVALRCILSLIAGCLMTNDWQSFGWDVLDGLFEVLADVAQLVLVLLIFVLLTGKQQRTGNPPVLEPRFFAFRNRFQLTVLLVSFIPSVLQLGSRISFDCFFGTPQSKADLIWMVVYYMLDFISFIAGYLVVYLTVFRLQIIHSEEQSK